jgi:hypothetical protein
MFEKICSYCNTTKSITEFSKAVNNKDGYEYHCKSCNKIKRELKLDDTKARRKELYQLNRDKMLLEKSKYTKTHKSEKAIYDKEYRQANKEKMRYHKQVWEAKNKDNPIFKIKRNLRRRIHHVVKDNYKSAHTFDLIGCSPEEFKLHIESQFTEGMSWDNYGQYGWHIDHIIPCYKFDLSCPEQQKQCFHFTNQRPLWAKDNLSRTRD